MRKKFICKKCCRPCELIVHFPPENTVPFLCTLSTTEVPEWKEVHIDETWKEEEE